jgi:E3 ubiquitin-protein ligase CHFR
MSRPPIHHPLDFPFDLNLPIVAEHPSGEPSEALGALKRRASSSFEIRGDNTRKRLKEDFPPDETADAQAPAPISSRQLADDLEQELLCGCCSALLYRPVAVYPCQHYFCGR